MANPWQAENIIESEKALALIQNQFPAIDAATIALFGSGWDNTAYLINDEYIFRFPRREVAVNLLVHEMFALPKLADKLPLAIPNPQWQGKPTEQYPWPFLGYRILPGHTACGANLSDEQRAVFVAPLAHFLKALHHVPFQEFEHILPGDVIDRLNVVVRTPGVISLMQELEALGLLPHKDSLYAIVESSQQLPLPQEKVICHGDLYVRHLLINDQNNLTGIIDWGDIHLNSSAVDLSIVHTILPPYTHTQFKKIYGAISQETWELARFRALNHCLNLINFGYKSGDLVIEREGKRGLGNLVAAL
jgi:aminoglycoside phosphotransferase (APT) family kinase protein